MPKKPNNVQGNLSKETKSLLRKQKDDGPNWRIDYARRVGGYEFDDVEPSMKNKTSGTVFQNVDPDDLA